MCVCVCDLNFTTRLLNNGKIIHKTMASLRYFFTNFIVLDPNQWKGKAEQEVAHVMRHYERWRGRHMSLTLTSSGKSSYTNTYAPFKESTLALCFLPLETLIAFDGVSFIKFIMYCLHL